VYQFACPKAVDPANHLRRNVLQITVIDAVGLLSVKAIVALFKRIIPEH
jgi:hypothetical protein